MSRFSECLHFILEREGGYCDHPSDRGGATNKGITQASYDSYRISRHLPIQPVKFIAESEVSDIYQHEYWRACRCDILPTPVDLVVFDGAVNHGINQSVKFLQRALGVGDDGLIGPMTIDAAHKDANSGMTEKIVADIIDQRQCFYQRLVERDDRQSIFLNGWLNRLHELKLVAEKS